MKSLLLNSKFTHNNIRVGLGVCFLILLSISILSHSTLWDRFDQLFDSFLSMVPHMNIYDVSWIPVFIATVAYFPYMAYRQKSKTEKLRTKLASDLHDDLGSILNSVNIYTDLALIKGEATYIRKIKEGTQEAINGIRNIIWQLDDEDPSFSNLVSRIRCFAGFLCQVKQIRFNVTMDNEALLYELNEEEKRNLYMIIKEAINNSVKYAEATDIELTIELDKGKPVIIIRDNGKGFNETTVIAGNGIRNIKTRANSIRYLVQIDSSCGTEIKLQKK